MKLLSLTNLFRFGEEEGGAGGQSAPCTGGEGRSLQEEDYGRPGGRDPGARRKDGQRKVGKYIDT